MREIAKLGGKLLLIAAVAGLALGITNEITKEPVEQQARLAENAARIEVLPTAVDFEEVEEGVYCGKDANGAVAGYVTTTSDKGYGGPVEVTVGIDVNGVITGVSIGGSNFNETAGLGARVKEEAFRMQFVGKSAPVDLTKNGGEIDAVASATVSSTAVRNAVNAACDVLIPLATGEQTDFADSVSGATAWEQTAAVPAAQRG